MKLSLQVEENGGFQQGVCQPPTKINKHPPSIYEGSDSWCKLYMALIQRYKWHWGLLFGIVFHWTHSTRWIDVTDPTTFLGGFLAPSIRSHVLDEFRGYDGYEWYWRFWLQKNLWVWFFSTCDLLRGILVRSLKTHGGLLFIQQSKHRASHSSNTVTP